jgi:acyl-coenzyme A thioesterase 13
MKCRALLGGEVLAVDGATGKAKLRYVPGPELENPNQTVLGGYLAAMIDDSAGLATWFGCGQRPFATAQMSTSFLRTAKSGQALIADVTVTGAGARQGFISVELRREADGKLVATGTLVQTFI